MIPDARRLPNPSPHNRRPIRSALPAGSAITASAAVAMFLILGLLAAGCADPFRPKGRTFADAAREIYVLNDQAETLSVINADTLEIHRDVQWTGSAPNHLLERDGNLYITNSLSNSISVISEDSLEIIGEIYLGYGRNPWMIIPVDGSDEAYVPNFLAGTVSVVNLKTLEKVDADPSTPDTVDDIDLKDGAAPEYRVASEGGCYMSGKIFVCNTGYSTSAGSFGEGTVSVIDVATNAVVATVSTGKGSNPQAAVAIPSKNEVHVVLTGTNGGTGSDDGQILVLDADSYEEKDRLDIGGSPGWSGSGLDEANGVIYLTGIGGLLSYEYGSLAILHDSSDYIDTGADDELNDLYAGIAVDTENDRLLVGDFTHDRIVVIDADLSAGTYTAPGDDDYLSASDGPVGLYLVEE